MLTIPEIIAARRAGTPIKDIAPQAGLSITRIGAILAQHAPELVKRQPAPHLRAKAYQMLDQGRSPKSVAKELKIDLSRVQRWARPSSRRPVVPTRKTSYDPAEVVRLYLSEGWQPARLGQRYGVSAERIRQVLVAADVYETQTDAKDRAEALRPEIIQAHDRGQTPAQIALDVRLSERLVRGILGSHPTVLSRARKARNDRVVELHHSGRPWSGIATEVGMTLESVRRVLAQAGIKPPANDPDDADAVRRYR